jgi:hypothetical protein
MALAMSDTSPASSKRLSNEDPRAESKEGKYGLPMASCWVILVKIVMALFVVARSPLRDVSQLWRNWALKLGSSYYSCTSILTRNSRFSV